jgi:acyl-CoA dehydrogenase
MAWDFSTDPEFESKLEWARGFVREHVWSLDTIAHELDWHVLDRGLAPLRDEVKQAGLWAAHLPPELGGQGYGQVRLGLLNEILGTTRLGPEVFGCQAPDSGNAEILALFGTPDQKHRYLEPLLAGAVKSCFSMTEPGAGADPTLLTTRASRDGDDWIIDGHKWFSSNASIAEFLIVMAVTDPDAPPHERASLFVLPTATPGVNILRDVPTMANPTPTVGQNGGHAEIRYEHVRVAKEALLGEDGAGFKIAQSRLGPGRIHHCMRWLGVARRAFDMLCERATYRRVFGSTLAEKQTVQNWITDSAAELQAARLMTLHAAWVIDTEGVPAARTDIGLIKVYGARVLHDVIDRALQAHGSLGFSTDLPLEQMYRSARAARIYDGPDEVHRQSVARQILRRYAPPPDEIPSEYLPRLRAAARERFGDLLAAATAND